MSENELNETQPNQVNSATQPQPAAAAPHKPVRKEKKKNGFPRWLAALVFLLVILVGVLAGYGSGMTQRYNARDTEVTGQLQQAFVIGMQAMDAGQYEVAQQQFDFIINEDPNYPGIQAAYTDLLLRMQVSPTPTLTATPTITPTPDLRGAEAIFTSAEQALANSDWDTALANLDSLRKIDKTYRAAEVDGMYFTALRMRGVGKILAAPCEDINLEGGIYDLTLASNFSQLDNEAEAMRTWSRLYLIGASYWDQDWDQAQYYFAQVMAALPGLSDSSCMSSTERWRYATIKVAERLLAAGDTCGAEEQFIQAFALGSAKNEPYYPTATEVSIQCDGGEDEGGPVVTDVPLETPTEVPTTEGGG